MAVQIVEVKEAETGAVLSQINAGLRQSQVLVKDDLPNWGSDWIADKKKQLGALSAIWIGAAAHHL
jgi:hypothetical protein